jgi:hypothetical protein
VAVRVRCAALGLVALVLTGCQTTAEKSAKLEQKAKREQAQHPTLAQKGLSIARASTKVKVVSAAVIRSSEGAAAVVTLRNVTSSTLREVPIAITVTDAHGRTVFQNNAPDLEAALVSLPSLAARGEVAWVDDQLPASGEPAAVSARVGEGSSGAQSLPSVTIAGTHLIEDPTNGAGAAGTVRNRSSIAQRNLVVFAVARQAGRIVAAGRAVVPELTARAATPFQLFFVGDPRGARLQISAPPTTFR